MICAYLDESGNTGSDLRDDSQPLHHVGALLVPEEAWAKTKAAVSSIATLARRYGFPSERVCELHGKEMLHGSKGWRKVSLADRLVLLSQCLDVIEHHGLSMVAGGCNKRLLRERYLKPEHPHSLALWLCLERVARVAKQRNQLAIMVADDCSNSHKDLSRTTLLRYWEQGAPYGATVDFSSLIDIIHFMPSHDSPHIQLCDVVMYIQHRYRQTRDPKLQNLYYRCNRLYATDIGVMPY